MLEKVPWNFLERIIATPSGTRRGDKDVAVMVPRFTGAGLGLLAFTISTITGLFARNPVSVVLSRSILALFIFCLIGMVLGTVAQMVVSEYEQQAEEAIRKQYPKHPSVDQVSSASGEGEPLTDV